MNSQQTEAKRIAKAAYQRAWREAHPKTEEQRIARNAYQLAWAKAHPLSKEKRIALSDYIKQYFKTDHGKASKRKYTISDAGKESKAKSALKWNTANSLKIQVHKTVKLALKLGQLTKPSNCEVCDKQHKLIHGHHCDYSKPLIVMWLCSQCHRDWHMVNGKGLHG